MRKILFLWLLPVMTWATLELRSRLGSFQLVTRQPYMKIRADRAHENFTLSISPHSESDVLCEREEPNDKSQMTQ